MKKPPDTKLKGWRIRNGAFASDDSLGNNGVFFIKIFNGKKYVVLKVIASDGEASVCDHWEHVSVSLPDRCPTWNEMLFIKNLFWNDDEIVVQYHPKKQNYINFTETCLHLWRNKKIEFPMPPLRLV